MPHTAPLSRRRFLRGAAYGAAAGSLALAGAALGVLVWPRRSDAVRNRITIPAGDVPALNGPPYVSSEGRFYLLRNGDRLLALSWRCPDRGCRTNWVGPTGSPSAFKDPCYGCLFDSNGVRTDGPAPRPLDLMALRVMDDGSVRVDTARVSTRAGYAPDQATPYLG
jgi:cytochrome b6-f complex iron-sulfur subunit